MSLDANEVRELARLMNAAKDVNVGPDGLAVRFANALDADRAQELLAKQGRNPNRVNPVCVSAARRAA